MKPVIKPTVPHKHGGYHELIFLSEGAGWHQIDETTYEVGPFHGYYLKPGQVHCWDFSRLPAGFVLLFDEKLIAPFPNLMVELFSLPTSFQLERNPEFFVLLDQLYGEFKAGASEALMAAYLNLIVLKARELVDADISRDHRYLPAFYRFKRLLDEHITDLRTVEEYAARLNMTAYKLNTITQAVASTNATDFIKDRLTLEAKNLLRHTDMSVAEVAYMLNYTDPSNFIKFFKTRTNLTPREYVSQLGD
ncbi:helix-turn-helix domain-containing protein [Marinoscillum furvescens]|uniref:AraC family transcriptional regulator n=1 Tax=Marinoscillum furvescens DSM 4134 TaxID=1122208 RepID=A0A3D9L5J5_MARFU|nr:AraC family transcriptional regulator [Marinoscillum furvescens]REE01179.1 AraC family transcriptional regulator [Marinoscillum furvescens DSM 4134]